MLASSIIPAAFAVPTGLTFGNSGRNYLRNPNRTNFDMALFKHFAIKESMAFEFRAEAFNVFNHSEWSAPSGALEPMVSLKSAAPTWLAFCNSERSSSSNRAVVQKQNRPRKRPVSFWEGISTPFPKALFSL